MPVALPAWPDALRSRSLRIWSGTVLGLYLVTHFANIALGLVLVAAMEAAVPVLGAPWRSLPGTVLLAVVPTEARADALLGWAAAAGAGLVLSGAVLALRREPMGARR